MGAKFSLDGSMIPRQVKRLFDQRSEQRVQTASGTAVLFFRGRNHVVRVINLSSSGAMLAFAQVPNIGEKITIQFTDRGTFAAEVRWVREGRIGLAFAASLE